MIEIGLEDGKRVASRRGLLKTIILGLSAALAVPSADQGPARPTKDNDSNSKVLLDSRSAEYFIKARIPILGDIGTVGTFAVEEKIQRDGDKIEKSFRMSGHSKAELVRKGQSYGGSFEMIRRLPSAEKAAGSERVAEGVRDVGESFYSGSLEKKGIVKSETVVFHPDHAVAVRENGAEKKIEGNYGNICSVLEYFFDHEVNVGDAYKATFILDGHPYIFKCDVSERAYLEPYQAWVYLIDVTTYDGLRRDSTGALKTIKRKGGIRLWLSKDGAYPNTVLRMKINYKWYLTLIMEYKEKDLRKK